MIHGVILKPLRKFTDDRGWLAELFREDELGDIPRPGMSYLSETLPGVGRGPHEHTLQTDLFCFLGPSNFKVILWDHRKNSPSYQEKMVLYMGKDNPGLIAIPPGVIHGYKNIGTEAGWVINFPDKLYKGAGRKEDVDEIRHEDDQTSCFKLE